jgi:hypothetical protein
MMKGAQNCPRWPEGESGSVGSLQYHPMSKSLALLLFGYVANAATLSLWHGRSRRVAILIGWTVTAGCGNGASSPA